MRAEIVIAHHAAYQQPLNRARRKANRLLSKYLTEGGLLNARAFDKAAEAHQLAALREEAARKLFGIKQ